MIIKNVSVSKLHDEFNKSGINPYPVFQLKNGDGDFTFTEGVNMELVQQIIDAHDPTPLPKALTEMELLQEENDKLKTRLYATESIMAETSATQEMLIELLLELEVM